VVTLRVLHSVTSFPRGGGACVIGLLLKISLPGYFFVTDWKVGAPVRYGNGQTLFPLLMGAADSHVAAIFRFPFSRF